MKDFRDVVSGIENLYTWRYRVWDGGTGMSLSDSNCPNEVFWHDVFMLSFSEAVLKACEDSELSTLLGDEIGVLWIATPQRQEGVLKNVWLLGPVFTSHVREFGVNELMERKQISIAYKRELIRQLKQLPAIAHIVFCVLGAMQHFCVTNTRIHVEDIRMQGSNAVPSKAEAGEGEERPRSGAEQEALLLKAIREGNLHYGSEVREGYYVVPGTLAPGNALRQFQDEIITEITLCSRAAIEGGLSREMALSMSDKFIQAVEAAGTLPEVGEVHFRMRAEYIRRVHDLKQKEGLSQVVQTCTDYIDLNITSRLSVADVAASTGYAGYYVSRLFQKEMNQSLSDYIQKKKIEHAAFLLKNTRQSVMDIADSLHYSSPSHFCTMFRREKGVTPTQYRQGKVEQG